MTWDTKCPISPSALPQVLSGEVTVTLPKRGGRRRGNDSGDVAARRAGLSSWNSMPDMTAAAAVATAAASDATAAAAAAASAAEVLLPETAALSRSKCLQNQHQMRLSDCHVVREYNHD